MPESTRSFAFDAEIDQVLISEEALRARVGEMADRISHDYRGKDLLLVSVLKGSLFFTADLIRHVSIPICIDFISISSYGDSTQSSGVVRILKDLEENIGGRHLLVVEDIVDTGLTLGYLIKNLRLRQPASIRICALLDKPIRRILPIEVDYKGFEVDDKFVVGYGLDYAHRYRHLPCICTLKPEVIGAAGAHSAEATVAAGSDASAGA